MRCWDCRVRPGQSVIEPTLARRASAPARHVDQAQYLVCSQDKLLRASCPVLLLWGTNDIVTPVTEWEGQLHLLKSVVLKKIPECGHVPMIEKPSEFNAELLAFLLPIKAGLERTS